MTVCIAARSVGMILVASDRMLTAGDIQFEPPVPKLHLLTPSIVVMFSGDANLHSEILQDLIRDVEQQIKDKPDDWIKVKDVANLYLHYRNAAKRSRAAAAVLAPLGLDLE